MNVRFKKATNGFTLIELLLVVAIIAALAVSVFVALNPAKRIIDSNNARRATDVDTILSAVHSYIVDNKGDWPGTLSDTVTQVQLGSGDAVACATALVSGGCNTPAATACLNLITPLAGYLKSVPVDPSTGYSDVRTGYSISVTDGVVTVRACGAEGGAVISASR